MSKQHFTNVAFDETAIVDQLEDPKPVFISSRRPGDWISVDRDTLYARLVKPLKKNLSESAAMVISEAFFELYCDPDIQDAAWLNHQKEVFARFLMPERTILLKWFNTTKILHDVHLRAVASYLLTEGLRIKSFNIEQQQPALDRLHQYMGYAGIFVFHQYHRIAPLSVFGTAGFPYRGE